MSGNITDSLENLVTRPPKVIERGQQANEARDAAMAAAGMEVEQSSAIDFYLDRLQTDIKESPGRVFDVASNFAAGIPGALGDIQTVTQPEGVRKLPTSSEIAEKMGASGEGYAAILGQLLSPLSPADFKIVWGAGKALLSGSVIGFTGRTRAMRARLQKQYDASTEKIANIDRSEINPAETDFQQSYGISHRDARAVNDELLKEMALELRGPMSIDGQQKFIDDFYRDRKNLDDLFDERSAELTKQVSASQELDRFDAMEASERLGFEINPTEWADEHVKTAMQFLRDTGSPEEAIKQLDIASKTPPEGPLLDAWAGREDDLEDLLTNNKMAKLWLESKTTKAPGKAVQTGIDSTTSGKSDQRLNDFLENQLARYKQEAQGREILDDLIEAGAAPRDVSRQFWDDVYPKLNPEMQKQFQGQIRALGFRPGDVIAVDRNGSQITAESWEELGKFLGDDFGDSAEYLEGGERGYVALMEWANRQAKNLPDNPKLPKPTTSGVGRNRVGNFVGGADEPITFYRGGKGAGPQQFRTGKGEPGAFGEGIYFTEHIGDAEKYAGEGGNVVAANLDMKNPYVINLDDRKSMPYPFRLTVDADGIPTANATHENAQRITKFLQDKGYDGVIVTNGLDPKTYQPSIVEAVVFDAKQVKANPDRTPALRSGQEPGAGLIADNALAKPTTSGVKPVVSEIAGEDLPRRLRDVAASDRYTLVEQKMVNDRVERFNFRVKGTEDWPGVRTSIIDQDTGKEYQHPIKEWYNPEIAELKPFRDKWGDSPKLDLKEGWSKEIPATKQDDLIYRGISAEEYAEIQKTGEIKSLGEYNIGESQAGWTLYSTNPENAASYANSFAPVQFKATPDKPAYVIAVKRPDDVMPGIPGQTLDGTHERAVNRALPSSDIVEVYEGVPYLDNGIETEVVGEFGGIYDGSGSIYGSTVAWRKLTKPTTSGPK